MTQDRVIFGGISVSVPEGWEDITSRLETPDAPYTLGRSHEGIGALQFSPALYRSGPKPNLTPEQLLAMVREFGVERGLGPPSNLVTKREPLTLAAASYHSLTDFVRVWYVSDGANLVHVTYVADWAEYQRELSDCEAILGTLEFHRGHSMGKTGKGAR